MIIWSTAALGDGRATLSRGYSCGKNERLEPRNEDVRDRNRGRERERARPWLGRVVIQMKLEAYETCIFLVVFFWYPNAHLLATSYNRPSEWDRASVRGRETDGGATRKESEATSFILAPQSSAIEIIITWKFDLPFWPIVRFYLHHFALIEQKDILRFKCNLTSSSSSFLFFFLANLRKKKKNVAVTMRAQHKLRR